MCLLRCVLTSLCVFCAVCAFSISVLSFVFLPSYNQHFSVLIMKIFCLKQKITFYILYLILTSFPRKLWKTETHGATSNIILYIYYIYILSSFLFIFFFLIVFKSLGGLCQWISRPFISFTKSSIKDSISCFHCLFLNYFLSENIHGGTTESEDTQN